MPKQTETPDVSKLPLLRRAAVVDAVDRLDKMIAACRKMLEDRQRGVLHNANCSFENGDFTHDANSKS